MFIKKLILGGYKFIMSYQLPEDLKLNYSIMMKSSENNPLKILSTVGEQLEYLIRMEAKYGYSTSEHIVRMCLNDYEGSVEERTWYRIAKTLNYNK